MLLEVQLPAPEDAFPFNLPFLQGDAKVALAPVTVFVGENGSGKSTLLEALALACDLPAAGSTDAAQDNTLEPVRPLADALKLSWTHRTRQGLFFRAEDYFGFVKAQNRMKAELRESLVQLRLENPTLPEAEFRRISAPYSGSLAATEARYGADLDAQSHGESFLAFFKGRLSGRGLYLLDEPEAALSPLRQLAFLSLLKEAAGRGAQILLATHAPILMAYPGALLYELREGRLERTAYDDLESVRTMREFLGAPESFTRHL
jgi:predicted ATPase